MRQGRFSEAFNLRADEVREMFGDKYDDAIARVREYMKCREEHGGGEKKPKAPKPTTPNTPVSPPSGNGEGQGGPLVG